MGNICVKTYGNILLLNYSNFICGGGEGNF